MDASSVIAVGNRVRRTAWPPSHYVDITAVGQSHFLAVDAHGTELAWACAALEFSAWDAWELWTPPRRNYYVEIRPPKQGDHYLSLTGQLRTAPVDLDHDRVVIVDD